MSWQEELIPSGNFQLKLVVNEQGSGDDGSPEAPSDFANRFAQSRNALMFIAARVLGDAELVEEAVRNCFQTASRNPPAFESEKTFGSWLLRILIDEALLILRPKNGAGSARQVFTEES